MEMDILTCSISSADSLSTQFGPRSGQAKCRTISGSKQFDTLIV